MNNEYQTTAEGKIRLTKANFLLAISQGHTKSKKHPAHNKENQLAPDKTLMEIFNIGKTAMKGLFAKDADLRSAYAKQTANYNSLMGITKASNARRATEVSFEDEVEVDEPVQPEEDETDEDDELHVMSDVDEDREWA